MDCVIIVMLWVVIGAPRSYPVVDLLVSLSRLPMPILQHVFSDLKMPMEEGEVLIRTTVFVDMEKTVFQKLSESHSGRGNTIDIVQISVHATTKLFQESRLMNQHFPTSTKHPIEALLH
jgi:hypothetical protein